MFLFNLSKAGRLQVRQRVIKRELLKNLEDIRDLNVEISSQHEENIAEIAKLNSENLLLRALQKENNTISENITGVIKIDD